MQIRLKWMFAGAVLLGAAGVLGWAAVQRPAASASASVHALADGVWVTAQITPGQVASLGRQDFAALVDLRPDGEVAGQPASAEIAKAATARGMRFHYIPVPHGAIPATAVSDLEQVLSRAKRPVLLYCHSGRRAARTWALAEASRAGGLSASAIQSAVRDAGQSADDLQAQIVARIAVRTTSSAGVAR